MKKEIFLEDENSWKVANILAQIEYHKKEGAFSFMFPPMLSNYLLQLKKNFTYLDVRNIVSMDSIYAIRFYGFCKEFERFGKFQFSIDEIRKMFNLENKYELYGLFKQKVIVKAQEELNKNSDLIFNFREIKEGKKVVALFFEIEKNPRKNQLNIDDSTVELLFDESPFEVVESIPNPNAVETITKQLFEKLAAWSISFNQINEWIEKYPVLQVELGVDYVLSEVKKDKNKIKNVPAYLSKIVASSQLMNSHLQKEEEKNVVKAMLKKNNEEQKHIEQQKQAQNEFLEKLYQEKKVLAENALIQHPSLYKRILDVLAGSLYSSIYYDNYLTKVGTSISKETFLAYFKENTGFEAIVITTLETFKDIDIFKEHQKKHKAEALKFGLTYY